MQNLDQSLEHYAKCKDPKKYILYDPVYRTLLKWQNYGNGEQNDGCRGNRLGRGEENGREVDIVMKGNMGILVVMEMFCNNINILVVILYHNFARYYQWRKLDVLLKKTEPRGYIHTHIHIKDINI